MTNIQCIGYYDTRFWWHFVPSVHWTQLSLNPLLSYDALIHWLHCKYVNVCNMNKCILILILILLPYDMLIRWWQCCIIRPNCNNVLDWKSYKGILFISYGPQRHQSQRLVIGIWVIWPLVVDVSAKIWVFSELQLNTHPVMIWISVWYQFQFHSGLFPANCRHWQFAVSGRWKARYHFLRWSRGYWSL